MHGVKSELHGLYVICCLKNIDEVSKCLKNAGCIITPCKDFDELVNSLKVYIIVLHIAATLESKN